MATDQFKRRLLSFSLRAFLLSVLLFAAAFGWLRLQLEKAGQQRKSVIAVEKLGGRVTYEYQEEDWDAPPGPKWMRNLLGSHFFDKAVRVEFEGRGPYDPVEDLSCLSGMDHLRLLYLQSPSVTDISPLADKKELWFLSIAHTQVEDLSPLATLHTLRILSADRTRVSDLSPLKGHKLQKLWLRGTSVSDISVLAGMEDLTLVDLYRTKVSDITPLSTATELESLNLNRTDVSDLTPLAGMQKLRSLDVGRTRVTAEGVRQLQAALPECSITGP